MPVYLDYYATTPVHPKVASLVLKYMVEEFGNAGSRTHDYGQRAKKAVSQARQQIANSLDVDSSEVFFTSGATESNNMAILGLAEYAKNVNKMHIISTMIEHKAVLEPLAQLQKQGFSITLVPPNINGRVESSKIEKEIRPDTLLVSVMHVNNETGMIQPLDEIADMLKDTDIFFHSDAAQGFGKRTIELKQKRIDLISLSGHKIFAPKGIGALIVRKRNFNKIPLSPITFGGGQELGLRPGTLPVHLIAGLGLAAEIMTKNDKIWNDKCGKIKTKILTYLKKLNAHINGAIEFSMPNIVNFSLPNIDSEAAILALKDILAVSNGSACTSSSYQASHVLKAMNLNPKIIDGAMRFSWTDTTDIPINDINKALASLIKGRA